MFLVLFFNFASGTLPVATEVLLGIASALSAVALVGLFTGKNYPYLVLSVNVFLHLAADLLTSRTWMDVASVAALAGVCCW